ncbi:MAG: phage tail protein, partial [Holophagales bacterium]|nr:phage tail protein [Holophagales bacterium]
GSSNTGGNEGGAGGSGNAGAAASNGGDANPADVIFDMLTHPIHGMNFPPGAIDSAALADYRAYASAASLLVSAAYEEQKQGIEVIKTLLECTNAMPVWSDGKLRIVPLGDQDIKDGDGNILWQANSTPLYALNSDDFLGSDDPVRVKRNTSADAYNSVKIKFSDRALEYAENVVEASDLAMQDLYGIRDASEFNADCIANIDAAQKLAQIQLQKYVGIRNEYEFNLGWRYIRLEPGDLATLTEPGLGLNNTPVRITSIEEDMDGELISYQTAANTGTALNPNRYNLTTIKRGLFSTQAASHAVNSKFMRLDDAVAVIDLSRWNNGETIYLKFLSFNGFGQSLQDPALVNPITYKILGTGLTTWKAPTACTIAITDTMPS